MPRKPKYKNKNGLYQLRIELDRDSNGVRRRKAFYGATYEEAAAKRDEWRLDPLERMVEEQFMPFISEYLENVKRFRLVA